VYLRLEAPRLALADFDAALHLEPNSADALSGRGRARALIGDVASAVTDAEAAVKQGPVSARLLFNAACIYATAAAELDARPRNASIRDGDRFRYQDQTVDLLRDALEQVPEGERRAYWRDYVLTEPVLAKLQRHLAMQQLATKYGR
jgi:hypothetical protein